MLGTRTCATPSTTSTRAIRRRPSRTTSTPPGCVTPGAVNRTVIVSSRPRGPDSAEPTCRRDWLRIVVVVVTRVTALTHRFAVAVMRTLSARIAQQGGAALIVDYGYEGPAIADTLQAVRGHAYANPFDRPGEQDLSAHVDFTTLAAAAQSTGLAAFGPVTQRDLLGALGIDQRTASLARAHPDRAEALLADRNRLMQDMGTLFRVLAVARPDWPVPAGYGE